MKAAIDGSHRIVNVSPGTYDESLWISDSDRRVFPDIELQLSGFLASAACQDYSTIGSALAIGPDGSAAAAHPDNRAEKISEELRPAVATPVAPEISKFEVEQQFEGIVLARDDEGDSFTARLRNQRADSPDEEAEFTISELPDDRHLIMPGAMFTWVIGLQWRGTQSKRVSEVRFRRLPPFTKNAIAEARIKAEQRAKMFAFDVEVPSLIPSS